MQENSAIWVFLSQNPTIFILIHEHGLLWYKLEFLLCNNITEKSDAIFVLFLSFSNGDKSINT